MRERTLTIIVVLLAILLAGIALLCRVYQIGATVPDSPGYQSVLSHTDVRGDGPGMVLLRDDGRGADGGIAGGEYRRSRIFRGWRRRSPCIIICRTCFCCAGGGCCIRMGFTHWFFCRRCYLILFGGITDRLIPLYAIGVFMAFTLSQAGMVVHWRRHKGNGWMRHAMVNGVGAVATGITLLIVLVAKFVAGAWVTALLIPLLILAMVAVRRHYTRVSKETANPEPLRVDNLNPPLVIIPLDRWSRLTEKALRFALCMSPDIIAVHVESADAEAREHLR